jgi:hypothetical protein
MRQQFLFTNLPDKEYFFALIILLNPLPHSVFISINCHLHPAPVIYVVREGRLSGANSSCQITGHGGSRTAIPHPCRAHRRTEQAEEFPISAIKGNKAWGSLAWRISCGRTSRFPGQVTLDTRRAQSTASDKTFSISCGCAGGRNPSAITYSPVSLVQLARREGPTITYATRHSLRQD